MKIMNSLKTSILVKCPYQIGETSRVLLDHSDPTRRGAVVRAVVPHQRQSATLPQKITGERELLWSFFAPPKNHGILLWDNQKNNWDYN